jgi:hypothetical protein
MRQRSDPFLPLLGSAVSIVVIAAIAVVFYPAAKRWFGADDVAVIGHPLSPSARVPVWIARADDGVALVLEATRDPDANRLLAPAFRGGPYRLLTLTVYNFDRETLVLDVPAEGLASPGGGPNALPAAAVVDPDAPKSLLAIVQGMGLATHLEIARGRRALVLLVLAADPSDRTAFVTGDWILERRELERQVLAMWRQRPDWKRLREF